MHSRKRYLLGCAVLFAAGFESIVEQSSVSAEELSIKDPPATHGMLVVGEEHVYLLHLPMFQDPKALKESPPRLMPHRYQVIVEATFTKRGEEAHRKYVEDRQHHPKVTVYTIKPEVFVLPELAAPDPRGQFEVEVFRGHFEKGGARILRQVEANVKRVVHFREFDPTAGKPEHLEYLLFGQGNALFLAHLITAPPDFDQVIAVTVSGHEFSDAALAKGVHLEFPGTNNSVVKRLKAAQQATAHIKSDDASPASKELQVEVGKELYFEEGELKLSPDFQTTAEEGKADFP